jgi:hypothetical protein
VGPPPPSPLAAAPPTGGIATTAAAAAPPTAAGTVAGAARPSGGVAAAPDRRKGANARRPGRAGAPFHIYGCPSDHEERMIIIITRSVNVFYPTVLIDDVSVKLPKSVSKFLSSGFRIVGRVPVLLVSTTFLSWGDNVTLRSFSLPVCAVVICKHFITISVGIKSSLSYHSSLSFHSSH